MLPWGSCLGLVATGRCDWVGSRGCCVNERATCRFRDRYKVCMCPDHRESARHNQINNKYGVSKQSFKVFTLSIFFNIENYTTALILVA